MSACTPTAASFHPAAAPVGAPRYLRVVVARSCPLQCAYCHAEGDPGPQQGGLTTEERARIVLAGLSTGVRKVKFLGGEPLIARDLPALVRRVRAADPTVDLSVITSGVVDPDRLDALFEAGLDRANLSIHGFGREAFATRRGSERAWHLRAAFLERLLAHGRPAKLNFVVSGPEDAADLGALLAWAAGRPVVVNVLDDLGKALGPGAVLDIVRALRGPEDGLRVEPDPFSLDTLRLTWADGLEVEVKHQQLGALSPWRACAACPVRARCREGIHAWRLSFDGLLRTCMDRGDIGLPLLPVLREGGEAAVAAAWRAWGAEVSP